MQIQSYRARLVVYIILLILFLLGTLGYSYRYTHQVILDEADNHLVRLKQLFNSHLNSERDELQRYAAIVAQDLRLKEYMYVVTGIGGDSQPLRKLYDREFGWLPIDDKLILTNNNQVLVGEEHSDLAAAVQQYTDTRGKGLFYYQGKTGLEVVAVTTIQYRDNIMGHVAVSLSLNQEWLDKNKKITEGEFFLIENKKIIKTTLKTVGDSQFDPENNKLMVDSVSYRIYQIDLPGNNTQKPALWFGLSEKDIIAKLEKHRRFMLGLIGVGIAGILLLGLIIIRNFSRPLNQIKQLTYQVAAGELPALVKHKVTNEFDELSNHFADMLKALREQQKEIEITQNKLEQSAITDSLTGLYNRRYLQEVFPKLLAQTEREKLSVYATLLDLDLFKKINDTYGHIAGDQCLISFADQLKSESRISDYLFRIGGEEFLILSVHKNIMEAASFADKLRSRIEDGQVRYAEHRINMTVSGGISCAGKGDSAESTLEQMLSQADAALYKAKSAGRNRVCIGATRGWQSVTEPECIN